MGWREFGALVDAMAQRRDGFLLTMRHDPERGEHAEAVARLDEWKNECCQAEGPIEALLRLFISLTLHGPNAAKPEALPLFRIVSFQGEAIVGGERPAKRSHLESLRRWAVLAQVRHFDVG